MQETYSSALAAQVEAFLTSQHWNFDFQAERGLFRLEMRLSNKMNTCRMIILVGGDYITAYAVSPISADAQTKAAACDFISRANYGLRLGNFELDHRDGELRFKNTIFCGEDLPSLAVVERNVTITFQMWQRYGDGLLAVIFSGANPAQEIAKIED
jgi:hypothetical protein